MKLEQSFEVPRRLKQVWRALVDVEQVAPCLPGAAVTGRNDDGSYAGTFSVRIGPTSASYAGRLVMEAVDESTHTATLYAAGNDRRGQGGAKATIISTVSPSAEGGARVSVNTEYHITGRLARFGRGGMIEDISERLLREFANRLQASLAASGVSAETLSVGNGGGNGTADHSVEAPSVAEAGVAAASDAVEGSSAGEPGVAAEPAAVEGSSAGEPGVAAEPAAVEGSDEAVTSEFDAVPAAPESEAVPADFSPADASVPGSPPVADEFPVADELPVADESAMADELPVADNTTAAQPEPAPPTADGPTPAEEIPPPVTAAGNGLATGSVFGEDGLMGSEGAASDGPTEPEPEPEPEPAVSEETSVSPAAEGPAVEAVETPEPIPAPADAEDGLPVEPSDVAPRPAVPPAGESAPVEPHWPAAATPWDAGETSPSALDPDDGSFEEAALSGDPSAPPPPWPPAPSQAEPGAPEPPPWPAPRAAEPEIVAPAPIEPKPEPVASVDPWTPSEPPSAPEFAAEVSAPEPVPAHDDLSSDQPPPVADVSETPELAMPVEPAEPVESAMPVEPAGAS